MVQIVQTMVVEDVEGEVCGFVWKRIARRAIEAAKPLERID